MNNIKKFYTYIDMDILGGRLFFGECKWLRINERSRTREELEELYWTLMEHGSALLKKLRTGCPGT